MIAKLIRTGRAYWSGEGLGSFLVRSVAGTGAVQLAGMAVGFLVGVQLARGLGVTGYGYYGIAMAVITLATIPGTLGIPKLVTREVAAAEARGDVAAMHGVLRWADRTCWRSSAAIALIVAIGAAIAWRTSSGVLAAALLFGAPMVALLPLASIRAGALRGLHDVVLAQVSNILAKLGLALLLLAVFLSPLDLDPRTAMALNSVAALAALTLTQFWLSRRLPRRSSSAPSADESGWLGSAIPMALTDAASTLQQQLSVLLLGVVAAPMQAGLFRVSMALVPLIAVPTTVVSLVVLPMFARLHAEGDHARLQKLVTATAIIRSFGVTAIALPIFVAADPLLRLVFGQGYVPAAGTIRIIAVAWIIDSAFGPNAALLNMTGHERRVTRAVLLGLIVNLTLVALLAPHLGSIGSAIGILAGQSLWNAILWFDCRRRLAIETSILRAPALTFR